MEPTPFFRRPPVLALLLLLAAAAAYATSLRGVFIYDDLVSILDNPSLRRLSWATWWPPAGTTTSGRPLANLTLALNYAWGGEDPTGYHVVNWAIHAAAGLALFGLVRRTLLLPGPPERWRASATPLAFAVALLWTLHPLQTEAVTYIVQRVESLMGACYLATLYGFVRAAENPSRRRWRVAAVLACAAGMATKEVMVSAPVVAWLYDRIFLASSWREVWRARRGLHGALASTWLLLLVLVASTGWNRSGSIGFGVAVDARQYWLTQFEAITHYLRLAVWPHPLVFDYATPTGVTLGAVWPHVVVVAALVAGTVVALWRWHVLGFLGAVFFAPLVPTSLFPGTTQVIVEHRMYLSLAPVLLLLVLGLHAVARRPLPWLVALAAVAAGTLTAQRNLAYHSRVRLWADTFARQPQNTRAEWNLAIALAQEGNLPAALAHYAAILRREPDNFWVHYNYALALQKTGDWSAACAHYEQSLRLRPDFPEALCNYGEALLAQGQAQAALTQFQRALALRPEDADVLTNVGVLLIQSGQAEAALGYFQRAQQARPEDADSDYHVGLALLALGRKAEAIPPLEHAQRRRPQDADIQKALAAARAGAARD